MQMKPESVAFLRDVGLYPEALAILETGGPMTITGDVLAAYLRTAWQVGRHSARDVYAWHSVAELMGEPGA